MSVIVWRPITSILAWMILSLLAAGCCASGKLEPKTAKPPKFKKPPTCRRFEYAAKYMCGHIPGPPATALLAPGEYRSEVNVHNAGDGRARVIQRIVPSPGPAEPGDIGSPTAALRVELEPHAAFQIDCTAIDKQLDTVEAKFHKGFVLLESDQELDVVDIVTVKEEFFGSSRPGGTTGGPPNGPTGPPFHLTVTFTVEGPPVAGLPYPVDGVSEITVQMPMYLPPGCVGDGQPMNIKDCPPWPMVSMIRDRVLRPWLDASGFSGERADQILAGQKIDYLYNPPVSFSGSVSLDFEFVPVHEKDCRSY